MARRLSPRTRELTSEEAELMSTSIPDVLDTIGGTPLVRLDHIGDEADNRP